MSRQFKLYVLSLILFASAAVVLSAAAEFLLRAWTLSDAAESRDHVEATPWLPARFRADYSGRFWDIPFRTNRFGFRDEPDFPVNRAPGEFRVLSLGDSIGFGLGVAAEAHYTRVAQQLLESAGRRVRVINAGGQGYSPSGYYVYLRHEGMELQPSMLVVEIELCNDISDEAFLEWRDLDPEGWPRAVAGGRYQVAWDGNLLGTYATGVGLLDRTYLGTILVRRLLSFGAGFRPEQLTDEARVLYSLGFDQRMLKPHRIEGGWDRAFGALEATQALAQSRGIPFLLMIMPSRYLYEGAGVYTEQAGKLYARACQEAALRGLPFVGLREPLGDAGGARLFFDFAHLTEAGNRVVGEVLAQHLALRLAASTPE